MKSGLEISQSVCFSVQDPSSCAVCSPCYNLLFTIIYRMQAYLNLGQPTFLTSFLTWDVFVMRSPWLKQNTQLLSVFSRSTYRQAYSTEIISLAIDLDVCLCIISVNQITFLIIVIIIKVHINTFIANIAYISQSLVLLLYRYCVYFHCVTDLLPSTVLRRLMLVGETAYLCMEA